MEVPVTKDETAMPISRPTPTLWNVSLVNVMIVIVCALDLFSSRVFFLAGKRLEATGRSGTGLGPEQATAGTRGCRAVQVRIPPGMKDVPRQRIIPGIAVDIESSTYLQLRERYRNPRNWRGS